MGRLLHKTGFVQTGVVGTVIKKLGSNSPLGKVKKSTMKYFNNKFFCNHRVPTFRFGGSFFLLTNVYVNLFGCGVTEFDSNFPQQSYFEFFRYKEKYFKAFNWNIDGILFTQSKSTFDLSGNFWILDRWGIGESNVFSQL